MILTAVIFEVHNAAYTVLLRALSYWKLGFLFISVHFNMVWRCLTVGAMKMCPLHEHLGFKQPARGEFSIQCKSKQYSICICQRVSAEKITECCVEKTGGVAAGVIWSQFQIGGVAATENQSLVLVQVRVCHLHLKFDAISPFL